MDYSFEICSLFGDVFISDDNKSLLAYVERRKTWYKINNMRYQNSLFPVQLSVYDIDGIDGIYIPGAITRDVAKQYADRAIQGIGQTTLDPSLGAHCQCGIEAARDLMCSINQRITKN